MSWWSTKGEGRPTVLFTVDVQHAKDLATAVKLYGITAEPIWGGDPDRALKLSCHQKGTLKVLANCQLLTEGYDDRRVSCIGVAKPTQSEGLYTQIVGRGTRIPGDLENLM